MLSQTKNLPSLASLVATGSRTPRSLEVMGFLEVVSGQLCLIAADEFVPQLELKYVSSYQCHLQVKKVFFLSVQNYCRVLL